MTTTAQAQATTDDKLGSAYLAWLAEWRTARTEAAKLYALADQMPTAKRRAFEVETVEPIHGRSLELACDILDGTASTYAGHAAKLTVALALLVEIMSVTEGDGSLEEHVIIGVRHARDWLARDCREAAA